MTFAIQLFAYVSVTYTYLYLCRNNRRQGVSTLIQCNKIKLVDVGKQVNLLALWLVLDLHRSRKSMTVLSRCHGPVMLGCISKWGGAMGGASMSFVCWISVALSQACFGLSDEE